MARKADTYRAARRNTGRGHNAAILKGLQKITGLARPEHDRLRATIARDALGKHAP